MARRVSTVGQLARKAEVDVDEMLIRLWDVGLERYREPEDKIRRSDMDAALQVAELPTKRQLTDPEYWMERLSIDEAGFRRLLGELGLAINPRARTVPRGAVAKLSRVATRTSAPPSPSPVPVQEDPDPSLDWRVIGHERSVRCLSEEDVEGIHWALVQDFDADSDPINPPGIRDRDLLGSAVYRQHTSFGDAVKYPTVEMAGAALFHALVHDHPFHNGNKRTALVALLVLLDENGLMVKESCEEDELFQLVLRLAQHRVVAKGRDLPDREVLYLADWIRCHTRRVELGERPVQWRKLKQILAAFNCSFAPAGRGNRLNITRVHYEQRRLRSKKYELSTQVKYTDDGRQAMVDTVKKIRRDLWLDDEHGVDSQSFYQRGGLTPSQFIVKYRKTLQRLAKL
jgi:death-on-curing family protein